MTVREMLERLIGFETVSRDSNLALIDFVRDYLDGHGVTSHLVHSPEGDKANLYATIGPHRPGGVVLSGHTDVVPVDGQPWSCDPFRLTERDGRLLGRGSCDMKAFIAIALARVPQMGNLKAPIHLALSYDEEVGCQGAPAMIRELVVNVPRPAAVIVGEPTSMAVVSAHKGITACRTTVTGFETHSSQTQRGVSAVMTAARLITWLEDLARQRARQGPLAAGFEPPHTTIHVGTVQGGTAVNIISRHCEFMWDIRNIAADDPREIVARFQAYCREEVEPLMRVRSPDTGIETQVLAQAPAMADDPHGPAARLALELTEGEHCRQVAYAAEAGQFQEAGLPTVICGPGSIDQAHQPNEYIELAQLEAGTRFIDRLIQRLGA